MIHGRTPQQFLPRIRMSHEAAQYSSPEESSTLGRQRKEQKFVPKEWERQGPISGGTMTLKNIMTNVITMISKAKAGLHTNGVGMTKNGRSTTEPKVVTSGATTSTIGSGSRQTRNGNV